MKLAGPGGKDFELKHVDTLISNINRELEKIEGRSLQGFLAAAAYIFDDMDRTPPRIPIDTGNLRASFFIVSTKGGGDHSKGTGDFTGEDASEMKNEKNQITSMVESALMTFRQPAVGMGFSANYATFVHENLEANFAGDQSKIQRTKSGKATAATRKFTRRPGAGPRFFSTALERNQSKILEIVAKYARIQ